MHWLSSATVTDLDYNKCKRFSVLKFLNISVFQPASSEGWIHFWYCIVCLRVYEGRLKEKSCRLSSEDCGGDCCLRGQVCGMVPIAVEGRTCVNLILCVRKVAEEVAVSISARLRFAFVFTVDSSVVTTVTWTGRNSCSPPWLTLSLQRNACDCDGCISYYLPFMTAVLHV